MAFILSSAITIGAFTNVKVNDVKIVRSVHSYIETAVIKLPTVARLKQSGKPTTNIDQKLLNTGTQFKVGDAVQINLGYDGDNNSEFQGFIKRVNFTSPLELECEGYSYQLRQTSFQKTFQSVTMRELLQFITKGTDIKVSDEVGDMNLGKQVLQEKHGNGPVTACQVLDSIKEQLHLQVYFKNFTQLYAGLEQTQSGVGNVAKYQMGWNVIRDNDLKWHVKGEAKLKVIVTSGNKDGSHIKATTGEDGGSISLFNLPAGLDQDLINSLASEAYQKFQYTGYQGKIICFLQPYAAPVDEAMITDVRYPERSGSYFIESIEVEYGRSGARRHVGIGESISQ